VELYANAAGYDLDSCFWDAAVSGADPVESRPGFAALLKHVVESGVAVVLVESADRFARSILAQELGLAHLASLNVRLVTSGGVDLTDDSNPERVMIRHMAGAVAQYDKAKTVQRLRAGRDRVRAVTGRCEGRKAYTDLRPGLAREARRLARRNPKTGKVRSLRQIAVELAALGYPASSGKPLSHSVVREILMR
jgi:DNA invertase Pin-like site-specific DNA recombinase